MKTILIFSSFLVSISCTCLSPLGMENGDIKDNKITSSSSFEPNSVGAEHGRLNSEAGGGAWCPKGFVSEAANQFLEIDLGSEHYVGGVVTQGRFANGLGQEFAEFFLLQYWRPGMEDFKDYTTQTGDKILAGNTDTFSESRVLLDTAVSATKVRLVPYSVHPRTVCMRVELLGCNQPPKTLALENSLTSRYLGIMTGVLLTLTVLLMGIVLVLLRKRGMKRYPSLSSVSISGSVLERRVGDVSEPVYQEPGVYWSNPPAALSEEYSTPISVIYSRPSTDYQVYQTPDYLRGSSTDISYLDESSVDSCSSSGTPRLPPLPSFEESSVDSVVLYVNQSHFRLKESL